MGLWPLGFRVGVIFLSSGAAACASRAAEQLCPLLAADAGRAGGCGGRVPFKALRVHVPKSYKYTLAPMYLYREYFKAQVYTVWAHGSLGKGSRRVYVGFLSQM